MKTLKRKSNTSYLLEAKILFASGQLENSIACFTKAENIGCNIIDVCLSRGAARMAIGRYSEAREDFTRVLAKDNKNERAYYFRGLANIALGEYEKSISDLTQSLKRNNDRGIAHLARGLAYAKLGMQQDAILDLNSGSAFSDAELNSFRKLFGENSTLFNHTRALLAEDNAPWNNLLSKKSAGTLLKLLQRGS